jgi:hypothetical protein
MTVRDGPESAFIEAAGSNVICLSWLKTINRDYHALAAPLKLTSPFKPLTLAETPQTKTYGYHAGIDSRAAEIDLAQVHTRYFKWAWPKGL